MREREGHPQNGRCLKLDEILTFIMFDRAFRRISWKKHNTKVFNQNTFNK